MRVKVSGILGQVVKPFGRFHCGDKVEIVKIKITNHDFLKSRACVSDGQGCYWIDMSNLDLLPADNMVLSEIDDNNKFNLLENDYQKLLLCP